MDPAKKDISNSNGFGGTTSATLDKEEHKEEIDVSTLSKCECTVDDDVEELFNKIGNDYNMDGAAFWRFQNQIKYLRRSRLKAQTLPRFRLYLTCQYSLIYSLGLHRHNSVHKFFHPYVSLTLSLQKVR